MIKNKLGLLITILTIQILVLDQIKANDQLLESQPEIEIQKLLELVTQGNHSVELYENLGFAYFQKGNLANAVLYYEKAAKLQPHDQNIQKALSLLRSELPVQITDIDDFVLVRLYRNAYSCFSSTTWSVIQILSGLILLFILYEWLYKSGNISSRLQWISITSLLILILISSFFAYHRKQVEIGGNAGISMMPQTVFQAPDERSEVIVDIGPGNKVFLLDSIGEWYKIQLRDKDIGWIKKDNVALI